MTTCAWLVAAVEPNLVGQQLLTDREHRAIESATGRPLASAVAGTHPDGRLQLHRPDLVLISDAEGGQMVAIEVELTLKTRTRLERILRGYARNRRLASVRYYARPSIAEAVGRAADRSGAADLVDIRPLPQVCNGDRRGQGHQHEAGGHHERRRGAA
jgi:hypothetical protein